MSKIPIPAGEPAGRIFCPHCGNVTDHRFPNQTLSHPETCKRSQVPQIFTGSPVRYSPSMRAGETVESCGACDRLRGNSKNFVEIADNVMLTSHYIQNHDGSFSQVDTETEVAGGVQLFCGQCSADLSVFHHHFREMIF